MIKTRHHGLRCQVFISFFFLENEASPRRNSRTKAEKPVKIKDGREAEARTKTEKQWDEGPSGEVKRMKTFMSEALVNLPEAMVEGIPEGEGRSIILSFYPFFLVFFFSPLNYGDRGFPRSPRARGRE